MKAELLLASHVTYANLRSLQASRLSAMSTMFNYAPRLAALSTIKQCYCSIPRTAYRLSGVAKNEKYIVFYNGLLHSGSPKAESLNSHAEQYNANNNCHAGQH